MALPKFCLNDESKKNSHGFYLLNGGGRFDRFQENPVMLDNHDLNKLLGRWDNLRAEGAQLVADPVFDDGTALGAERKGQVERGFLRGASPGIVILKAEWRRNPAGEDLYVTEWELFEGSTTSVPSNAGAVTLRIYTSDGHPVDDKDVRLHVDQIVKLCADPAAQSSVIIPTNQNMEKINLSAEALVALGIKQDAAPEALSAAIVALHAAKTTAEKEISDMKAEAAKVTKVNAEALVDLSIKEGRIVATDRDDYVQLAVTNYALAQKTLQSIPAKTSLSASVTKVGGDIIPADRKGWAHLRWLKEDPSGLQKLKAEHPDTYKSITNPQE